MKPSIAASPHWAMASVAEPRLTPRAEQKETTSEVLPELDGAKWAIAISPNAGLEGAPGASPDP